MASIIILDHQPAKTPRPPLLRVPLKKPKKPHR